MTVARTLGTTTTTGIATLGPVSPVPRPTRVVPSAGVLVSDKLLIPPYSSQGVVLIPLQAETPDQARALVGILQGSPTALPLPLPQQQTASQAMTAANTQPP